jgi:hypothetical protein
MNINTDLLLLAALQLFLSLFIGVGIMFITIRILKKWVKSKFNIEDSNIAFAILTCSALFSAGYILLGAMQPILTTLRILSKTSTGKAGLFISGSGYIVLYIVLGLLISVVANIVTISLYNSFTKDVDEMKEISEGKLTTALVTGTILVVVSLFVRDAYTLVLETFIPYPQLPIFN